jgi:hypothetical protein
MAVTKGKRADRSHDPEDILLATDFSVAQYRRAVKDKNAKRLVSFVENRFLERYIKPVSGESRHGFAIIAICCLMIESLVSFRRGWNSSEENGDKVFADFFRTHEPFNGLAPVANRFYGHVRNGLLHQAETTGGWRIRRDGGPLFDPESKTIEADRFRDAVEEALRKYCDELRDNTWDSDVWKGFRRKVDAICRNAGAV